MAPRRRGAHFTRKHFLELPRALVAAGVSQRDPCLEFSLVLCGWRQAGSTPQSEMLGRNTFSSVLLSISPLIQEGQMEQTKKDVLLNLDFR